MGTSADDVNEWTQLFIITRRSRCIHSLVAIVYCLIRYRTLYHLHFYPIKTSLMQLRSIIHHQGKLLHNAMDQDCLEATLQKACGGKFHSSFLFEYDCNDGFESRMNRHLELEYPCP